MPETTKPSDLLIRKEDLSCLIAGSEIRVVLPDDWSVRIGDTVDWLDGENHGKAEILHVDDQDPRRARIKKVI